MTTLPVDIAKELRPHEVATVHDQGWTGLQNGELLRRAQPHFDVFVTIDRNLPHQQNLTAFGIAVILVLAKSNRLPDPDLAALASNQRMKLPGRGGYICRTKCVLSVAAAPRSLCALRWADASTVSTRGGAHR